MHNALGATYSEILRHAATEWELKPRMTDEYIRRAKEKIKETSRLSRSDMLEEHIERRRTLFKLALQNKDLQTALRISDSEAKLLGLFIERQEIEVSDNRKATAEMTDEELTKQLQDFISSN